MKLKNVSDWDGKVKYIQILYTMILVRKILEIKDCVFRIIDEGNFSSLHFEYDNRRDQLKAIYGPNTDSHL